MIMPFVMLGLGLLLILLEFYLPGAIMGTLGGLMILTGMISFASQSDSLLFTVVFILFSLICVGVLIWFALWRIPRAKPNFSIYLNSDQAGYQASTFDASMIGRKGVARTDLKPGGYITIEGKQYQAISLSGYITKGTEVEVISGLGESLNVKSLFRISDQDALLL